MKITRKTYNYIKSMFIDCDISELIRHGTPIDEYDPEIKMIIQRIDKSSTPDGIERIIWETFSRTFGAKYRMPNYQLIPKMSEMIYMLLIFDE